MHAETAAGALIMESDNSSDLIYAAENRVLASIDLEPLTNGAIGAQHFLDTITSSRWWAVTCPPSWMGNRITGARGGASYVPERVLVRPARTGGQYAHYCEMGKLAGDGFLPVIRLCVDTQPIPAISNPWAILHELAHIMMAGDLDPHQDLREHPREYAHYMLLLLRRWLTAEAAVGLRQAYTDLGVRHRQART